ncbi:MAG TPA: cellulase family glycosylhydrolase [Oligoflexia bacterium]|nr:cellulase family glycosylhydrolase [Oligoflexia bacterium]HMP47139.1 cellulase family glycosylhydrolase [Oligoflexia bacterium]
MAGINIRYNSNSRLLILGFSLIASCSFFACSDASDLLSLALSPPKREPIQKELVGVNNFFVDREFGSISEQYDDISKTLGLRFVRVLFAWTDDVQRSPNTSPNFSFYDDILAKAPPDVDILVVLAHTPRWFSNPGTRIDPNPRLAWIEQWLKPTISRYRNHPRIIGFEIFNEPDLLILPQDAILDLQNPENYFEMLAEGYRASKSIAPSKLAIMTGTTSIQQSFPTTLRYNQRLRDLGAESFTDVWNIHYYSSSYESVVTSNGVADFLNRIGKPVWVTESGAQGPNNQLAYVETAWPFLKSKIGSIERFYQYQYGETGPIETNYGLRTTNREFPLSDLYIHLRDGTR